MIIISIEGCKRCHIYHKIHPEYTYIELKKGIKKSSVDILKIKKTLKKLNFDFQFPVLLNDKMTKLIPYSQLKEEIKNYERI